MASRIAKQSTAPVISAIAAGGTVVCDRIGEVAPVRHASRAAGIVVEATAVGAMHARAYDETCARSRTTPPARTMPAASKMAARIRARRNAARPPRGEPNEALLSPRV